MYACAQFIEYNIYGTTYDSEAFALRHIEIVVRARSRRAVLVKDGNVRKALLNLVRYIVCFCSNIIQFYI